MVLSQGSRPVRVSALPQKNASPYLLNAIIGTLMPSVRPTFPNGFVA